MSFISFAIFYSRWIPFFEHKILLLQQLIETKQLDAKFNLEEFNRIHQKVYNDIKK